MPVVSNLIMFSPNVLLKFDFHFCLLRFLVFLDLVFYAIAPLWSPPNFKYMFIFGALIPDNFHNLDLPFFELLSLQKKKVISIRKSSLKGP
jgi:hypothetical protein